MRSSILFLLFVASQATMFGCAATGSGGGFASRSLWKKPVEVAAKEKDEAKSETKADIPKSENPFRKTADASKSSDTKPVETTAAKEEPAKQAKPETVAAAAQQKDKPPPQPDVKKVGTEFDVETMKLIDEKLADASPEERAYWFEQLKRVDRAVIPQILEARQLTADIVERRQSAADRPFPNDGEIRQVAAKSFSKDSSARTRPASDPSSPKAAFEDQPQSGSEDTHPQSMARAAAAAADKSQFPVQRVTGADSQKSPTGSSASSLLPSLSAPRNALNRLLPNGRSSQPMESAASTSAAVDLLQPIELDDGGSWEQQLSALISVVEADVAQLKPDATEESQTDYIKRHVYLRMLYLMDQHPERALAAIPGIDAEDQEFWQQTLWAMTNYFDVEHLPAAKDRAGQAVTQLASATQRLRERSNLEIHNLAFCSQIDHFGNFLRFARDEFHPGERVLIYAEIENFKSELTVEGEFRTLIRSSMEILSPSGDVRWQEEFPAEEDLCTSYRRDYFHNYTLTIPDRLPLGPHTLKLSVFDELSGKMVSQSVNFVVR